MKASDLFLRCLEQEGVDTIYGVPGEENADLLISMLDSSIEFIVCRHEQAAAFMADMHGRITGRPGVCLSTLGPGATNLMTGVTSANMDHSPLVAIIGQASTRRLHKESHQNMDAISAFQPITKWAQTIRDPDNIPEVVHKAFRRANSEKPGAVVVELPEDIAKEDTDTPPIHAHMTDYRYGTDEVRVQDALKLIENAKRPVMLLGYGCIRSHATQALTDFVDRTGIYAATTFMGKGSLSARSPQSLFTVGLGARDLVLEAFERADLVLCVGYDMVEWHPERWNVGEPKRIIHIDTEPAEADAHYVTDMEIVGSIVATMRAFNNRLGPGHRKELPELAELRARIEKELRRDDGDTAYPMKPQRIIADLRAVLGDQDIVISDVGAHKMWIARQFPAYERNTCFITNGFCSMGFALPSAIAAKRLNPDRNVVAVCGDGGFMMNVQDLITAVRYHTPIVVMIWEDGQYGLIRWKQDVAYHRHSHIELMNPDFLALAGAFGCQGIRVEKVDELRPALERAIAEKSRPTVIVVRSDGEENLRLTKRLGELLVK